MRQSLQKRAPREDQLFAPGFDLNEWKKKVGSAAPQTPTTLLQRFQWLEKANRLLRRFHLVRKAAMLARRFATGSGVVPNQESSIFKDLDVAQAVDAIRRHAYYDQIRIPPKETGEILDYVASTRCRGGFGSVLLEQLAFFPDRVPEVEKEIGQPINIAHYDEPEKNCAAIGRILQDPKLLEIVCQYLGAQPLKTKVMLWWSFVTKMAESERLKEAQTIDFHFDELGSNSLYISFYLSDVGEGAGAHVLIRGSHSRKPLSFLCRTASLPDSVVLGHYGREAEVELRGKTGAGFIEDPFCYHKATIPSKTARLFLQFRYYL